MFVDIIKLEMLSIRLLRSRGHSGRLLGLVIVHVASSTHLPSRPRAPHSFIAAVDNNMLSPLVGNYCIFQSIFKVVNQNVIKLRSCIRLKFFFGTLHIPTDGLF